MSMNKIKGKIIYLTCQHTGLMYRNLSFYTFDLTDGSENRIACIPAGFVNRTVGKYRLATRLLRLEPKCVGRLDDERFVVCVLGALWLLDIHRGELRRLNKVREGFDILNFCEYDGNIYWGDYGANNNYEEINIYKMDNNLNISIVYCFPKNSIRHIHNIIKTEEGFFLLAGDNEPQAGIYRANADWTEVKPWKCGEQKYRAVVGFPYNYGLLYATDSVETENRLRHIAENGDESILAPMNGSCIYGGETKNYYVFSTTVESPEGKGILGMFSRKLGGGIKSDDVHVVTVSKQDLSIKIIAKFKKDFWPMKLMQYGQAFFAGGQRDNVDGIWCYPMSCKKYDGRSVYLGFNE